MRVIFRVIIFQLERVPDDLLLNILGSVAQSLFLEIELILFDDNGRNGIYEKLSAPYEELQQMLYEKYGEDYE